MRSAPRGSGSSAHVFRPVVPLFEEVGDLRRPHEPRAARRGAGKALRQALPRSAHGAWRPAADRPDALAIVLATNAGREPALARLRLERMSASPFAWLRGAAAVMAWDLSRLPATGVPVVADGDAHLGNFGLYGTPQREVVFDLNDFDEAGLGAWEWDLKRLVVSVDLVARENGLSRGGRRRAVEGCARAYREAAAVLAKMGALELWYLNAFPGRGRPLEGVDVDWLPEVREAAAGAAGHTGASLLPRIAERRHGRWRFRDEPPVLRRVTGAARDAVIDSLRAYAASLPLDRRVMLRRYRVVDVAHRAAGVGSLGLRSWLVLLIGEGPGDPLVLQVKEAVASVLAPYSPPLPPQLRGDDGVRVVHGQRTLQASVDPLLGHTRVGARACYVRQLRNLKGSVPLRWSSASRFGAYAASCGAILARAHARSGDAARIAGYCGHATTLDEALARFADAYGDQVERDHAVFARAVRRGAGRTAA
ncbi:MAG TPA: DUF2252 domain-containing protein [Anaeromyxobacter sp.]